MIGYAKQTAHVSHDPQGVQGNMCEIESCAATRETTQDLFADEPIQYPSRQVCTNQFTT